MKMSGTKTVLGTFTIEKRHWRWKGEHKRSQSWGKTHILVENDRKYAKTGGSNDINENYRVAGDFKILVHGIGRVENFSKNSAWWRKVKYDQRREIKSWLQNWNIIWWSEMKCAYWYLASPKIVKTGHDLKIFAVCKLRILVWTTIFFG